MGKVISFDDLETIRARHPEKKIVLCHGVYDLFHYGHLQHIKSASSYGDILVVTVTPDRYINKGPGRPRYSEQQRVAMLASLELVDYAAINRYPRAVEPIHALRPHYYVKGPDYRDKEKDITGGIFAEEEAVKSVGGELVFTDDETLSSTELLNKYFSQRDEGQQLAIERVISASSLQRIVKLIDSLAMLKVLVVGEPIVDSYVYCDAEGISSKRPCLSARFDSQEDHAGGSLAIANHLRALGCNVGLLITDGGEDYFNRLLGQSLNNGVSLHRYNTPGIPTPRKTRFLNHARSQRFFELMQLRADQWQQLDPRPFAAMLQSLAKEYDLVVVADYGHGLFEGEVLNCLEGLSTYLALNVQTNSGNYGFNPFTKHQHYSYLSIDERELRIGTHDRLTPIESLARKSIGNSVRTAASITLGEAGSLYYSPDGAEHLCPAFFKDIVDATGAGDAYFAITSLLCYSQAPAALIPFLGNCFAGLKSRIVGNRYAVSKIDMLKTINAILS
jgi:cytidyltransferase-like protein